MTTQQTLRQGLEKYYRANPDFVRNQDLQLGWWLTIPWQDLQRHDVMHVVTGYSTDLDDEMRLIGFLLTSLTWRRPWIYYLQSIGTAIEVIWRACWGRAVGTEAVRYSPLKLLRLYVAGVKQGLTVRPTIDAYIDLATVLDQDLETLRQTYGIANAGAWDSESCQ
ncbi:MAG: hypothetical protein AAGE59_09720 [Cyanobacteria bacterium P01_F01_bin.86]